MGPLFGYQLVMAQTFPSPGIEQAADAIYVSLLLPSHQITADSTIIIATLSKKFHYPGSSVAHTECKNSRTAYYHSSNPCELGWYCDAGHW
jgi:hypothetical protein